MEFKKIVSLIKKIYCGVRNIIILCIVFRALFLDTEKLTLLIDFFQNYTVLN